MSELPFSNAVELDEWLSSNPDIESSNVAFKDQLEIARRESVAAAERRLGKPARWVPRDKTEEWLRLGAYDLLLKWAKGEVKTCIHRPRLDSPLPVIGAAWMPGHITCRDCAWQFAVDGDADMRCDHCGRVCQGMPDDGIKPISFCIGALAYHAGVCCDCDTEESSKQQKPDNQDE